VAVREMGEKRRFSSFDSPFFERPSPKKCKIAARGEGGGKERGGSGARKEEK
jgi:hypothetical protein